MTINPSLEYMIEWLEEQDRENWDSTVGENCQAIIAALRAGQRMRNCIADDTGARTRLNAAEAWDAAVKGDANDD